MSTQKWWDRDKHAAADPNSKDGIRHYSEAEIADYKTKVIEALKKREIKDKNAENLWQRYTPFLDEVIANDSPEEFAELIACDFDGNKKLSDLIPAFVSDKKSAEQIQSEATEDLEQIKKEAEEQVKMQQEAEEWINHL